MYFCETCWNVFWTQGQDLASGNLTAPVIFALRKSPELQQLIEEEFTEDGSLEEAIQLVKSVDGIADAMQFATDEALKVHPATCIGESVAEPLLCI